MATATALTANRAELLAIADAVAREKSIDRAIVIEAMEDAIQRAAREMSDENTQLRETVQALRERVDAVPGATLASHATEPAARRSPVEKLK